MDDTKTQAQLATWLAAAKISKDALIGCLQTGSETLWLNPKRKPFADVRNQLPLSYADIEDAVARLERFAAFFAVAFPETAEQGGIIESPLVRADRAAVQLSSWLKAAKPEHLLIKCDSELPISGSIKARGGFYEVLLHAEQLALEQGLLQGQESYACFATPPFRELFSHHSIMVGSTGNLGLSIGIISAKLGFDVTVHMSADARQWKKALLRDLGVTVVEHQSDYSVAVTQGREEASSMPRCHFIDDEDSTALFLGYAVAALRLKTQLQDLRIKVDAQHPLVVYLPCGVGGGPGGIAFGLKHVFGDAVQCFFAEPTHSPCMLLGMHSGLHNVISVQDIGLDNLTCADGLAVGRSSAFVGRMMEPLLDGIYTVTDEHLYAMVALIRDSEGLALEPSAVAGAPGFSHLHRAQSELSPALADTRLLRDATHVIWATGGSMVPAEEMDNYYRKGRSLL
ncbi:D-serine ammonia-lyase [Pseudomonas daroniae]|uniref:Probable D-serine dehydratase n=1 Tax=Phytopseudomonas daroniae TaxID=2487519 RepID=A0A4Q9QR95_9GAMM|nr:MULTISPECIES: D-serine ammonia-lyase [Pseudomonas]TBU83453.1 D-serine ammonia-lyase [Pseudomonas daroniae]TBU85092.1 D-serine ammonia-lyase [Pseudomonas sp. FRB 228]TBU93615.1 D-serine ammonia-lyase [Pseudomonas daroniae]